MSKKEKIFYITGLKQSSLKRKKPDWIVCGSRAVHHNGRKTEITEYHSGYVICKDGRKYLSSQMVHGISWGELQLPWMVKVTDRGDIVQIHLIGYDFGVSGEKKYYGFDYNKPFHELISINTRTGQTYIMPRREKHNNEWKSIGMISKLPIYTNSMVFRDSYVIEVMLNMLSEKIVDYILNLIMRKKNKMLGYRPQIYKWTEKVLWLIVSANAYSLCMPAFALAGCIERNAMKKIRASNDILNGVMQFYGISGKRFNKLFFEKPEVFKYARDVIEIGLSKDNEMKVMRKLDKHGNINQLQISSFTKCFSKLKEYYHDETVVVNKLLNEHYYCLGDTFQMLETLDLAIANGSVNYGTGEDKAFENENAAKLWLKKMYMSSFNKKVHDDVATNLSMISVPCVSIFYTKEEKKLEEDNGIYSVRLPKSNQMLSRIGIEMNICVGAYSIRSLKKNCTILYVSNKNGEMVACLELRENEVIQVKGVSNHLIKDPDLSDFLYNWMKKNHLDCKNCWDFNGPASAPRMLTDESAINHSGVELLTGLSKYRMAA